MLVTVVVAGPIIDPFPRAFDFGPSSIRVKTPDSSIAFSYSYDKVIEQAKHDKIDVDYLMKVIPVPFNHCKNVSLEVIADSSKIQLFDI